MNPKEKTMIGVVGGMGPYAGLDLVQKIFNETNAKTDQDHIPVSMISIPHSIEDRTKFLLDNSLKNPAIAITEIIHKLRGQGATVIGMPCNTAHAGPIFDEIQNRIPSDIFFVHMIQEVVRHIKNQYSSIQNVGILATTGTIKAKVYHDEMIDNKLNPITISQDEQDSIVEPAIYDKGFGIKAYSNPVKLEARGKLETAVKLLFNEGAEVVILGCTEIPLALPESNYNGIPLIDSTAILARALILNSNPDLLKNN
jgi:aspartate racemase|tara:strand:+ start:3131 stop:3895 length:765 start_codon:yes stop_codon:yes gene_type:complete